MKKWATVAAAAALVLAGLFSAQSASAAGSWQPYGSSFVTPSNWYCGGSVTAGAFSAQTCVVRSGNYVQTATIVRNNTMYEASAAVQQSTSITGSTGANLTNGLCSSSGVAAQSVSVCFTPTVYSASKVTAQATLFPSQQYMKSPSA